MPVLPLREFITGTLNGSGNGTIKIGPAAHGLIWRPKVVSIKMTGSTPSGLATCFVYAGSTATDTTFRDSTYDVLNAATDSLSGDELRLGQYVWATWSGGNPNATVTLIITGSQEV